MATIEQRASSTSPNRWRQQVDDSNVCLKRTDADLFHQHMNSIDGDNQFTIYSAQVRLQPKEAVVKTLVNRANLPSSCHVLTTEERERVLNDLKANRYPGSLLRKFLNHKTKPRQSQEWPMGFAILLYVKGASDHLGRILRKFYTRPVRTARALLKRPMIAGPSLRSRRKSELLYFYLCRGKRALLRPSMIQAAQETNQQLTGMLSPLIDHNFHPRDAQIFERCVTNYHKRLSLESWHSTLDSAAVDERKPPSHAYIPMI